MRELQPSDFLSKEKFLSLSDAEQIAYHERLYAAWTSKEVPGSRVTLMSHWLEVMRWVLSEDEYDKLIGNRLWSAAMENAGLAVRSLEEVLESPFASAEEQAQARELLEKARAMAEHKQTLDEL